MKKDEYTLIRINENPTPVDDINVGSGIQITSENEPIASENETITSENEPIATDDEAIAAKTGPIVPSAPAAFFEPATPSPMFLKPATSSHRFTAVRVVGHCFSAIGSLICAGIIAVIICWAVFYLHPDIYDKSVTSSGAIGNIIASISTKTSNIKGDVLNSYLSEADIIKKKYTIPEDATAAPVPNPDCYGTISYDEPEKVLEIIDKARVYRLLGSDERVIFSTEADFYHDGSIEYYLDETIMVICWKEWINRCPVNCVEIKIADASQFRRKLTSDSYGSGVQAYCSTLSKQTNAVVGFNADFYAFRNLGVTCYNRTVYRFSEANYGARKSYNCVDSLFIDTSGNFNYFERGTETTKEDLQKYVDDNDLLFAVAFGPILIKDGKLYNTDYSYPIGEYYKQYSRAGIGQVGELHYLFMNVQNVVNRVDIPRATLEDFAQIMYTKNLEQAYNLDGGQTGEIYINGHVFNRVDWGNERSVSDIIYFGTALPEDEQ